MKDKIIQITDTLTVEGDGQTLGLGESGTLYRLVEKTEKQDNPTAPNRFNWVVIERHWEKLL